MSSTSTTAKVLSPEDRQSLAIFCRICDNLASCRFVREFRQRSGPIKIGRLPDGTVWNEYPRYDRDDLKAFLTDYRKLKSKRDSTNFYRIRNLLCKLASDEQRQELDSYKYEVEAEAKSWFGVSSKLGQSDETKRLLSAEEIENVLFNAEVFHVAPEQQELWRETRSHGPVWEHAFLRYAMTVVHYARKMAEFIQEHDLHIESTKE